MDSEKELLDAFDRVVHEDFPSPQRILSGTRSPAETRPTACGHSTRPPARAHPTMRSLFWWAERIAAKRANSNSVRSGWV